MTLADILRQEGLEQGRKLGKVEALSETPILMLTDKFGSVPKEIKEGILNADMESLQVLLMNSYKFEKIDEVKRYIN